MLNREFLNQWLAPFSPSLFLDTYEIRDINKFISENVDVPIANQLKSGISIAKHTSIPACLVLKSSSVGAHCTIGPKTSIQNSVIHDHVTIGANVVIDHCIILS